MTILPAFDGSARLVILDAPAPCQTCGTMKVFFILRDGAARCTVCDDA